jgi:hypothetical protein
MISKWLSVLVVGLLCSFCALDSFGQVEKTPKVSQYIISAKAGGVNFVEGAVNVMRRSGTSGLVVKGDEILVGDKVTTGEDAMAEILLNPGSFLRIGHNTSFEFGSTDLENLRLNLRSGSAVLELYATDDFKVSIKLPQSQLQLTRSGVFRIDVMADGSARLTVVKGKAYVGPGGSTGVNAGRMAAVTKAGVSVSKFDKSSLDALDFWSKSRSKELASLNDHLQRDSLRNSLLSSFSGGGWNMYRSFGLWVFDPRARGWSFLPFGYGWASPYGWGYGWDLWRCRMPDYVWMPTYTPTAPVNTGGGSATTAQKIPAPRPRVEPPPFQRVEQTARTESNNVGLPNALPPEPRGRGAGNGTFDEGSRSFPSTVSTPTVMSPTPAAAQTSVPTKVPAGRTRPIDQ